MYPVHTSPCTAEQTISAPISRAPGSSSPLFHPFHPAGTYLLALVVALCAAIIVVRPAQAQAPGCEMGVCVTTGTRLAELDPTQNELLNALLASLTGVEELNLDVGGSNALAGTNVSLGALTDELAL